VFLEESLMLKANLKIVDTDVFAVAAMKEASKIKFNLTKDIKPEITAIITQAIMNSPTVKDLQSGKLRDDFGLFGNLVDTAVDNIIKILVQNIDLQVTNSSKKKSGSSVSLKLIPDDISALHSVTGGTYQTGNGETVNWLEWLLTRGSRVVVKDFWLFQHAKGKTRSGGKEVMVKISKTKRDPFRVDPTHSGTPKDNFITRAINSVRDDIMLVVSSSVGVI
jgi:hypothetical protein